MSVQTLDVEAERASEIISYDPATNEEIGRVPLCTAEEVAAAVRRARPAQSDWSKLTYKERGRFVMRARAHWKTWKRSRS